ncbi:hypothetical protein GTA26_29100 [Rhodococcus hoagii]|nr:hypothetical protein [Prescottella equi]
MQALLSELNRHEMLLDAFKADAQAYSLPASSNCWSICGKAAGWDACTAIACFQKLADHGLSIAADSGARCAGRIVGTFLHFEQACAGVYPGDPFGAWSTADNLERFERAVLNERLREPAYQQFFARFIRRRDSQRFFSQIATAFYEGIPIWATADLHPVASALSEPVFETLARSRVAHVMDDAATLAPPVNGLDRSIERAHEQRLAVEGWTLLGLASFWLPGLGLVLLAVTAWELMKEVYHGVDTWHDGETEQAMDHMTHVAAQIALMAGAAGAVMVWPRCETLDVGRWTGPVQGPG